MYYKPRFCEEINMRLEIPAGARVLSAFGDWTLYLLPQRDRDSFLWSKLKLMLPPGTRAKHGAFRSFRLAWQHADLRFGKDAVLMSLQRLHPDLYAEVELYMSLNHGADTLPVSEGEIAAELERLAEVRRAKRRAKR
jgi:hypothetical protein